MSVLDFCRGRNLVIPREGLRFDRAEQIDQMIPTPSPEGRFRLSKASPIPPEPLFDERGREQHSHNICINVSGNNMI